MSAGTQGFTDTRKDTNHIGSVISRILEARKLAEDERAYAESIADRYQTSLEEAGITRGYFFKKALGWKFGGEFKQKKISQINTWKQRGSMLKTAVTGRSGRNKLNAFERTQAIFDMLRAKDKPKTFRSKFLPLYEGFVDDPMLRPRSKMIQPGTAKRAQKALSKKKRVSKEDILDSLAGITEAIEKVAQSISEKNRVVADQMIHSSVLQGMMHQQLKSNADSLDDKLQKIITALSNQNQFNKEAVDKAELKDRENKLEEKKDTAAIVNFDNLLTKENESRISATSAQDIEFQQMAMYEQDIPKAETGAIFSGPDSGYLAELHGNEVVIPLDNNYTQGEPSAIDGKVRPKPSQNIVPEKTINSMPKYEMGTTKISNTFNNLPTYERGTTVNTAPISSKFGFNATNNITGIAGGGTTEASKLTQSMVDVMSLPMMAAGGSVLAATTNYMQSLGGEGANINPEIERVSRPIASVFGLPPSIVSATKKSVAKKPGEEKEDTGMGSRKDLFAKLTDGFGKLLEKLGDSINKPDNTLPPPPGSAISSAPEDVKLAGFLSTLEGGAGQTAADTFQVMLNRAASNYSNYGSNLGAQVMARGQFSPFAAAIYGSSGGDSAADRKYGPIREKLGKTPEERIAKLRQIAAQPNGLMELQKLFGAGSATEAKKVIEDFQSGGVMSQASRAGVKGAVSFRGYDPGVSGQFRRPEGGNYFFDFNKTIGSLSDVAPPSATKPTPSQLGQAITNNYGLQTGQERQFTHPEYGVVKAHKTATGFDFYKGSTKLDMSPGKPQAESIVDYFTKTNGGRVTPQIAPPASTRQQIEQQVSSISRSSTSKSGGGITVLNTGGGQQIASAGSVPPVSGSDGTEAGRNPTQDFYSNSFSLGVG